MEKDIKLDYEKFKITLVNEANAEDTDMVIEFTCKRDGDNKITEVLVDPALFEKEPSFTTNVYLDVVNVLMAIKKQFDNNKPYETLHVLNKDEYKEYVTKVLGNKIEG